MSHADLSTRSCSELRRHSFSLEIPRWMANIFDEGNYYNAGSGLVRTYTVAGNNSNDGRIW
jgi:hypothetical protein